MVIPDTTNSVPGTLYYGKVEARCPSLRRWCLDTTRGQQLALYPMSFIYIYYVIYGQQTINIQLSTMVSAYIGNNVVFNLNVNDHIS
jgi:hypothetical protein